MSQGKALIVNLSKGNLGTEPAHLLGALLITACSQAAEARRHIPEHARRRLHAVRRRVPELRHRQLRFDPIGSAQVAVVAGRRQPDDLAVAGGAATRSVRQCRNAYRLSRWRARRRATFRRTRYGQHGDAHTDEQLPSLDQAHAQRRADAPALAGHIRSPFGGRAVRESRRVHPRPTHEAARIRRGANRRIVPEDAREAAEAWEAAGCG